MLQKSQTMSKHLSCHTFFECCSFYFRWAPEKVKHVIFCCLCIGRVGLQKWCVILSEIVMSLRNFLNASQIKSKKKPHRRRSNNQKVHNTYRKLMIREENEKKQKKKIRKTKEYKMHSLPTLCFSFSVITCRKTKINTHR